VTTGDLLTMAPLIALAVSAVVVMLAAAFARSHALALTLTLLGLGITLGSLFVSAGRESHQVTPLLVFDDFALFVIGLVVVATAVVALLSWGYLQQIRVHPEEHYVLLLTATLGAATLAASTQFATLFLGLEILSVSLYALIAYPLAREESIEAAVKYLVLAGATSAFLVFGMALVYAQTGTLVLASLAPFLSLTPPDGGALVVTGLLLVLGGLGFKLAVVPLHMWTPDIYQGAPAPVSAYVATVSKGAVVALLLRALPPTSLEKGSAVFLVLALVAIASMLAGNLLALRQDNVKRILAYSSIANMGYVLVAFLATGEGASVAVTLFLVAYVAASLAAFGVVTVLSTGERDAERLDDYRGLAATRPWLTAVMTVSLFSLAGIPLTLGFVGKFFVLTAGAGAAMWSLVIVLVLTSTVGLYYYTRIIVTMFVPRAGPGVATARGIPAGIALAAVTAFVLGFGVYPAPLIRLVEWAVATLD
jgi:NADH-quinone oxidoreductase subunit N